MGFTVYILWAMWDSFLSVALLLAGDGSGRKPDSTVFYFASQNSLCSNPTSNPKWKNKNPSFSDEFLIFHGGRCGIRVLSAALGSPRSRSDVSHFS